jgi:hypothetical protein
MYGVPADLPIQRFVGDFLFSINLAGSSVHFCFDHSGTISVHGRWELRDGVGSLVDSYCDLEEREVYRVHVILNQDVTDYALNPSHSFSLTFASGHRLTVYDDTPEYESFAIQPDDIYV